MRRFSTVTIMCAAFAAITLMPAQAESQAIGFKVGASFANMDIDPDEAGNDGITGFVGGGFVRFGTGRFSLQGELLSVTKGTDFVDPQGDDDAEIRLEYVEIPVMLHVPFVMGMFSPYVLAGPTVALEVGCDVSAVGVTADCDNADFFDRKTTDFGLTAGGGLEFGMGPGAILVEGRYTWGLSNLNDSATDDTKIRNRAAYVMAGYTINLGNR